ncbi:hypothetical protein K7T73_15940 [Bacillus badius]|uniref:hypothetical protein n=1 Tax=Bacillus badius TaxID=1455 RepID=UPI001CBF18A1|nr:hypothetical protein [Bacillus badius]UAT30029.1 hypothetical protein K7T73_15940 [Bacillus badius]
MNQSRQTIESLLKGNGNPQIDESQPAHSPHNRLVSMRKKALSVTAEVLDESDTLDQAEPELKTSVRKQLMSMVRSGIISLGQTAETEEDAEIFAVCRELLKKTDVGSDD